MPRRASRNKPLAAQLRPRFAHSMKIRTFSSRSPAGHRRSLRPDGDVCAVRLRLAPVWSADSWIVALAQTVASYVMEGSDQGLKLIGARLLARNPALVTIRGAVRPEAACGPYCDCRCVGRDLCPPRPGATEARACVLVFDLAVIPYAFALDWVAWGLGHFGVLSIWRSGVSILYVALAIVAMRLTMRPDRFDRRREHLECAGGSRLPVDDVAAALEEAQDRRDRGSHRGLPPRSCGHPSLQPSDCRICSTWCS